MDKRKLTKQRMEDLQAIVYLAQVAGCCHLSHIGMEIPTQKAKARVIRLSHRFLMKQFNALRVNH